MPFSNIRWLQPVTLASLGWNKCANSIKREDVGEVITIEYKARDGLKITALITWPTGIAAADRKNLPLVVMPHGGPEAYDAVGFDWMAQFLANEGYVVLQPNFRGSSGFGNSFVEAGYGEWGRKMQDDITDGAMLTGRKRLAAGRAAEGSRGGGPVVAAAVAIAAAAAIWGLLSLA